MEEEDTIRDLIVEVLQYEEEPVPTLQIARHVFGDKATKKSVNRYMYAMEKDGLVEKTCEENGSKPKWSLKK